MKRRPWARAWGVGLCICMLSPVLQAADDKLKWTFQNMEVKALLHALAEMGQHNLIVADGVTGPVSLHLKDMTWREALDVVVQSKGLEATSKDGVLWISSRNDTAERLQALAITLKYAKALDVAQRLQGSAGASGQRWLSARGTVMAEPRTNQLFFLDTQAALKQLQNIIQWLDIPVRQVMIEAQIVEAEAQFGKSLGVRLGGAFASSFAAPFAATAKPVQLAIGGQGIAASGGIQPSYWLNLPAGSAGQTLFPPASFAVSLFNAAANQFLNLEISAMEADGKGKVIASPRVVTADQTKALIEQGTELPYQIAAANGATAVTFRKANLKLEVTPHITPEGGIVLSLDVLKDSVGQITPAGFAIDTKHVNTQVLVEDGGTVMIGGIFESVEQVDIYKVPVLGDIPGLGWLFRNQRRALTKQELLVFITPKMLGQSALAQ